VNEFIAGPASEVVRQGSNAMQGIDMVSRWSLYNAKVKEKIKNTKREKRKPTLWAPIREVYKGHSDKELLELAREGFRVFAEPVDAIDRLAMEAGISKDELKKIKDEAGMLALDTFIDYRLNVPQDIKMLSDYGVLLFPSFWMRAQKIIWGLLKNHPLSAGGGYVTADLLDMNGVSFIDVNIVNKALDGQVLHAGQDVLSVDTILLGVFTP
jgi:hypothetical protein